MTRMWMDDVELMCGQHRRGEHKEIHQLIGTLKKKHSVAGYIRENCIEITSIVSRHDELVKTLQTHRSPVPTQEEIMELASYLPERHIYYKVDKTASRADRLTRCPECRELALKKAMLSQDIDSEFVDIVNENFWELL